MTPRDDARWMAAALTLAERGRGRTAPNPNVGCVIVQPAPAAAGGRVVGRGWTQPGGRPHAEAMALDRAGEAAAGATLYASLEPCAHESPRGPACAASIVAAGVTRVVAGLRDPDPRTDGAGFAALRAAGIEVVEGVGAAEAARSMAGFLARRRHGRPHVTLKLALSLDGAVAMADGRSRWITGPGARAHAHLERARHEAILVGRGTYEVDRPTLDVRLAGLEDRSPECVLLTRHPRDRSRHSPDTPRHSCDTPRHSREGGNPSPADAADDERMELDPRSREDDGEGGDGAWGALASPRDIASLSGDHLLVEGGARTAAAFLAADLVDRLLLYRAPILVGGGRTLPDLGLADLALAHGRWRLHDARMLGSDRLEVYERAREA